LRRSNRESFGSVEQICDLRQMSHRFLKRRNITQMLLLITNRKLYSRFPLVHKSLTLDDTERPLHSKLNSAYACFSEPSIVNLTENRHVLLVVEM